MNPQFHIKAVFGAQVGDFEIQESVDYLQCLKSNQKNRGENRSPHEHIKFFSCIKFQSTDLKLNASNQDSTNSQAV